MSNEHAGRLHEWMHGVREDYKRRQELQQRHVWRPSAEMPAETNRIFFGRDEHGRYIEEMMPIENPYYWTLLEGEYLSNNISVELVGTKRRVPNGAAALQTDMVEKRKWWAGDEVPSRWRFEGIKVVDGVATVYVSPTVSYQDRKTWSDLGLTEQWGLDAAPLDIAATSIVRTKDNKLILTKRIKADYKKGGFSGVGGFMRIDKKDKDKDDSREDGTPDIIRALGREIREEAGINEGEISPALKGVYYNPISGSVNLSFEVETDLTSDEVKQRKHDRENELLFVDINPDTIMNLIIEKTNAFTTETLALLFSMGEREFGQEWADKVREGFNRKANEYADAIRSGTVKELEEKDINKKLQ